MNANNGEAVSNLFFCHFMMKNQSIVQKFQFILVISDCMYVDLVNV